MEEGGTSTPPQRSFLSLRLRRGRAGRGEAVQGGEDDEGLRARLGGGKKVRAGRLGVQRHERGDVVGVDGHRSRPLVQARGEVRQDRSSLAMGTARPAAGGGHIALPWGSRGPASPRRPARPRAPAAELRRTSADDRRMESVASHRPTRVAASGAVRTRRGDGRTVAAWQIWGSAGVNSPCAAAIIMAAARSRARSSSGRQQTSLRKCMLFILRLRSAIFVVVTSAEIIPSRQRGQFASSYIRIGEFVPELPRNPNLCVTPDPESHERRAALGA